MWNFYWHIFRIVQQPKNIYYSRLLGWTCQLLIGLYTWFAGNYFLNDSISYLTLAENLNHLGIFSQSYDLPIVPDIQRTPGYPFLLWIFPIPIVLLIQHLFSFVSQEYWAKTLEITGKQKSAQILRFTIPWLPYPMLFASLIAVESLYISLLAFFTYQLVNFIVFKKYSEIYKFTALAIILTYLKPITFVLFTTILFILFFSNIKQISLAACIFTLGVIPWFTRNYYQTGHCTFSTLGNISTHYGRTSGLMYDAKNDAERVAVADYIAGKTAKKEYIFNVPTEENEFFTFSTTKLWIETAFFHPFAFIKTQTQGLWGQLTGMGWKTAKMMTENYFIAGILSGIQLIFCLHFYIFLAIAWLVKKKNKWIFVLLFSGFCVFLAQNAVWADGRYRMILDPWALLITLYFYQSNVYEIKN